MFNITFLCYLHVCLILILLSPQKKFDVSGTCTKCDPFTFVYKALYRVGERARNFLWGWLSFIKLRCWDCKYYLISCFLVNGSVQLFNRSKNIHILGVITLHASRANPPIPPQTPPSHRHCTMY